MGADRSEQGYCAVCGRMRAVRANGTIYPHDSPSAGDYYGRRKAGLTAREARCPGSGKPAR